MVLIYYDKRGIQNGGIYYKYGLGSFILDS